MRLTLLLASLRYLLRHPGQLLLSIVGIALGVAVVVAIDLAKESARRAFDLSAAAITGKATHRIAGGPDGLDESVYVELRLRHGWHRSAPVVEGRARVPGEAEAYVQILGVDPLAERSFRDHFSPGADTGMPKDLSGFMTRSDAAILPEATARRLAVKRGDSFELLIAGKPRRLQVEAIIAGLQAESIQSLDDWVIVEIATAQELLGMTGRLTRIELILQPGAAGTEEIERLRLQLPPEAELVTAASRGESLQQMTAAFYQHLTALSLLALLVGVFLIYNTMSFIVVQRRRVFGILRALGVTRRELFSVILAEAAGLGAVGALLGILVGVVLGKVLLGLVMRTINDIYFVLSIRELALEPLSLVKAAGLGLAGSLFAALGPASEAAGVTPQFALYRSLLETRVRALIPRVALGGLLLAGLGLGILLVAPRSTALGFFALFTVIFGCAAFAPLLTQATARVVKPLYQGLFGLPGALASRGVTAALSRTGIAVAALMLAVATTVGIGLMTHSFRNAVDAWLAQLLRADFYIAASEGADSTPQALLSERFRRSVAALPGVADISAVRRFKLTSEGRITHLVAYRFTDQSFAGFQFLEGDARAVRTALEQEDAVMISEPYAYRYRLHMGNTIALRTDAGPRTFRIAGVYRDYTTEQGLIALSHAIFTRYWSGDGYSSFGIYQQADTDATRLRSAIRQIATHEPDFTITSNQAIRQSSLELFDRTFTITQALRLIAGLIAFTGIVSALMALQFERTREYGVLRACGLTPRQLWATAMLETGLIGSIAGLLALPVGTLMATLLVYAINRRSFGWSMDLHIDGVILLQGFALAVAAALLAGLYPAWKIARAGTSAALRYE